MITSAIQKDYKCPSMMTDDRQKYRRKQLLTWEIFRGRVLEVNYKR